MAVSRLSEEISPPDVFAPASLESVITTAELTRRPARACDHAAENRAVLALMDEMASASGIAGADRVLQKLVDTALRLCRAHSAGVSLLEREGEHEIFRWRAAAGPWANLVGGSVPRRRSPCGTALDRNMALLMARPERHFGYVPGAPQIVELLLIPFHYDGEPAGTLWIVAHDDTRSFDAEDCRLMTTLARFATTAYQLLVAQELKNQFGKRRPAEARSAADLEQQQQRTEAAVGVNQERLEAELADSRLLQTISAELITQDDVELHEKILDAAISIGHSDFASMQMFVDEPDEGFLKLIAYRGFPAESARHFDIVTARSHSTCGEILRRGARVIVTDVEQCDFMTGSVELALYLDVGVHAVQSTPLVSRGGRLVGVISTHWRRPHQPSERDLRLLDILARQAADLIERKQAAEALREADRRKDEFIAVLAHELRNPLAPIRNAIQILQMTEPHAPELQWASGVIDRQMGQLTRLVDDLLDVSRITHDRLELRTERVELDAVVHAAIETSRPGIVEHGHELAVTYLPEAVIVDADPTRLAQVFANLLNNAVKFSEPGGRITVFVERQHADVLVHVRDEGIGIAAAMLPKIFDLFSQLQPSLERDRGGLGIGLALVKRLVEMHGGSVAASSNGVGKGSEFVVRLPVVATAREAPRPHEKTLDETLSEARTPLRILVVDDYKDGATSMCRLLKHLGHETRMACDGLAGLEAGREFRPDVALLDIGMPVLNGYELARRLRAEPWGTSVVLVAVTGWGQDQDRQRTTDAGFDHHLVKPVMPEELMRILASVVTPEPVPTV